MSDCRHSRLECECQNPSIQPLSSGRWDATGSWSDTVTETRDKAFTWASSLDPKKLHWVVTVMASDVNAFTLYERKAILEVIALKLGSELLNESTPGRELRGV